MAEFVLDRFPLQELHVVDDQEVDVAQLLLERQRIVVADGGGEAPHEIFRRQVDDPRFRVLLEGLGGDRLQEMGLAEPDGGVKEKRIEPRVRFRHRPATQQAPPGWTALRRRTGTCSADRAASRARSAGIPCRRHSPGRCGARSIAAVAAVPADKRGMRRPRRPCAAKAGSASPAGARHAGRRAHDDVDLQDVGIFLLPQFGDQVEIVAVDPGAQECRRHRDPDHALRRLGDLHAAEPARIDLTAETRLELRLDPVECLFRVARRRHAVPPDQISRKRKAGLSFSFDAALHCSIPRFISVAPPTPRRALSTVDPDRRAPARRHGFLDKPARACPRPRRLHPKQGKGSSFPANSQSALDFPQCLSCPTPLRSKRQTQPVRRDEPRAQILRFPARSSGHWPAPFDGQTLQKSLWTGQGRS